MSHVGQPERHTQNRIVKLFRDELKYTYLGNWEDRPNNSSTVMIIGMELFSATTEVKDEEDRIDISVVKEYWLKKLSPEPKRFGIVSLADMLEETGWFISDFQSAFRELEKEGKAKNLDATRVRPVNAVNFEKEENLKRI